MKGDKNTGMFKLLPLKLCAKFYSSGYKNEEANVFIFNKKQTHGANINARRMTMIKNRRNRQADFLLMNDITIESNGKKVRDGENNRWRRTMGKATRVIN